MKGSATKWALATGASGGIGYELAKLLGRGGYSLVLVARSKSKLREIAGEFTERHGVIVKGVVKDLSRPEAPEELFHEIERQSIPVEILVNNAGFGTQGRFLDTDLRREMEMIRLNITVLTAAQATASGRGGAAVPARGYMPRAGGGPKGRPLTHSDRRDASGRRKRGHRLKDARNQVSGLA